MNVREAISLALGSLRTNKMRAFLTLLGIIVGITSVITIMTLGHSLKTQTSESIMSSGANDLMVQVKQRPTEEEEAAGKTSGDPLMGMGGQYVPASSDAKFDEADIAHLKEVMGDNIAGIPIGSNSTTSIDLSTDMGEEPYAGLQFVNLDYFELNPTDLVAGRTISQTDIDNRRPVIVISTDQVNSLFEGDVSAAIGSHIDLNLGGRSERAAVIGVYQKEETSGLLSFDLPGTVFMPFTLESEYDTHNKDGWEAISVRPAEDKDLAQVKALLQAHLTSMYRGDEKYMAEIQDFSAISESFNAVLNGISAAISAIAGISLLVGGIGVMNIMLVTVTERTREIGVRKALGATRGAIRLQFVVEAMMVCLVGGVIGVLLGGALGMLGSNMLGYMVFPPLSAVLIALGFSLAIGLFFGYYPANKAAKLDPIDALRYE